MTCKEFDNLKQGDILILPSYKDRRKRIKEVIISEDDEYYNTVNYSIQKVRCYSSFVKYISNNKRLEVVFYLNNNERGMIVYNVHKDLKLIKGDYYENN